ncbi:hypothetical protein FSOLCH5_013424 [Fusarium solani]
MRSEEIVSWLAHIKSTTHGPSDTPRLGDPTPTNTHQHHPPSPPESPKKRLGMDDPESPAPKRQKVHEDPNRTPKASSSRQGLGYLRTTSPTTSLPAPTPTPTASDTQSSASGRSSPSKQLASLEISTEGVEQRKLSLADPSLPPALSDLLLELQSCSSSGVGIVSSTLRAEIREQAKTDATFRVFMDHMFAAAADRDQLGPTLPVDEATRLVEEAAECQVSKQNELGWNQMVHNPLLYSAIYGRRRRDQLVGFAPCTTAKIIREYLPATTPAKMVDYCVYFDPKADPVASEAIQTLRRSLVSQVINHSDFQPFRKRPIAISIETKSRDRTRPEVAALQIGTWHSAQWRFLEHLVNRSGGSFDGLPFLPAVLVHGHDWSFAATTREGRKTVLWLQHPFGSSSDVVGVYKTVWCLQRLAQWAAEVYWPWFRENCLGVGQG